MPVVEPPLGGPLGRSRGKLSASALTTFLRCPHQWFYAYQIGLSSPTTPSQLIGTLVEDALCKLLMNHPPRCSTLQDLELWAIGKIESLAKQAYDQGEQEWSEVNDQALGLSWEPSILESFEHMLSNGLKLFLHEVRLCFDLNGGPYLDQRRQGNSIFEIREPTLGRPPQFPVPSKINDMKLRTWTAIHEPVWEMCGSPITWHEAWECARPWFKDPRVHQPQRLYHPEGWASGELDMVFRYDGSIKIVDLKAGSPSSPFAVSLEPQLQFYAWLWQEIFDENVSHLAGWYLSAGETKEFEPINRSEQATMRVFYSDIQRQMLTYCAGSAIFPLQHENACDGSVAGCSWCTLVSVHHDQRRIESTWLKVQAPDDIASPYVPLSGIADRVNVHGTLTGKWGPLPNHFGEYVHGAVLVAGDKHVVVEETEPDAFSGLRECEEGDVFIFDALPGVWRDQPRLYLDESSSIQLNHEANFKDTSEFTRLGLLRTRANVKGVVLSTRVRHGTRLDGKPWSMQSLVIWDGSHLAEVVAFGSSITQQLATIQIGHVLMIIGAEIGWRNGLLQLRIDHRKTRISIVETIDEASKRVTD